MNFIQNLTVSVSFMILLSLSGLQAQSDTLTILHVNDTHSNLAPSGTTGGIARAATVIGEEKMTDPNVLVLHAGDVFIGDLFFNIFFGVAELQLMNALSFDAMTVGNHEFDLTPAVLQESLDSSFVDGGFPLLSANIVLEDPAVQSLKQYIQPYTIIQKGEIKVGIFGMTTPETNIFSLPAPAVVDTNIIEIAADMIDTLSAKSCDLIICLSHLGFALDQLVAANIPGIDVIVGGHDHYVFDTPVEVVNPGGGVTWIVQAEAFYKRMGKLQITITAGEVNLLSYQSIELDEQVPQEATTEQLVNTLITEIEQIYGPVYSQLLESANGDFDEIADSLLYHGYKDTPIGNLVCDAFRAYTGTDVAIEPGGSTAQPLKSGDIYGFDIFRVVGYGFNTDNGLGFRLATFDISGAALWAGLEFGLSQIELNDEFLIQVSGLNYVYDPDNAPFERVLAVHIGGMPLDPAQMYSVTTNEFVVLMLDYLQIPYENLQVLSGVSEFEVLQGYVSEIGFFHPYRYGRIIAGDRPDSDFWRHTSAPLGLKFQDITISSEGHLFAAAENSGIFRSTDGSITWTNQNNGLTYPTVYSIAQAPNGELFAGSLGMFHSSDDGDTWEATGSTLFVPFSIAFKSEGEVDYIFAGTGGGIFRSTDNGASWDTTSNGLPEPTSIDVWDIAVTADGKLFAATGDGLYQSNDNGNSWLPAGSVFSSENIAMHDICINTQGHIFVGGDRSFKSVDGGQTWTELDIPGQIGVIGLSVNQSDDLYLATWNSVYRSGDDGESFQSLDSDLEDVQIRSMTMDTDGILFAASSYDGIFKSTSSTITTAITENPVLLPQVINLMQNYPNPFNPNTSIKYELPATNQVELSIYNLLGQKIVTLVAGRQNAGIHQVEWDGRNSFGQNVASGMYIYRLTTWNQQITRKMLLLR